MLTTIQQDIEEEQDMKNMFFDGGNISPSVFERIRNLENKTILGNYKHAPIQSWKQESLSRLTVIGRVFFTNIVIKDTTKILDLQEDM